MLSIRNFTLSLIVTLFSGYVLLAQTPVEHNSFNVALQHSGFIHSPLHYTSGQSLEEEAIAKTVIDSIVLEGQWDVTGRYAEKIDGDTMAMRVNFDTGKTRAKGSPSDPDYATYGNAVARLNIGGISLDRFNRLCLVIEPQCPGLRVVNINLSFNNRYEPTEEYNRPTGSHLIQLCNGAVNHCYLEIADFRRDCVDNIILSVTINGRDLPIAENALFKIHSISAQKVEKTEKVSGWIPDKDHIIYSQSGYFNIDTKTAICHDSFVGKSFSIINVDNNTPVFNGKVSKSKTSVGSFGVIEFTQVIQPGKYFIKSGDITTAPFTISGNNLWTPSCWKVLNFIFCQRCGYAVPGIHSLCHTDLFSCHNGHKRPYTGGWHDAGDLSQQTLQTADVSFALLELYDRRRNCDPILAARLREEALWGLDFVLRCRLGNGYHASSMGLLIWQDGIVDSHDDIESVRIQNLPYDNYLYAAYEAYAARVLDDGTDPEMILYLKKAAIQDYDFACEGFKSKGFGGWISPYEHTYCTSECQFMATASWAASQLYALTGDSRYASDARQNADYVISCQRDKPVGKDKIYGFFYRNPNHRSVIHFIHQSREQILMQSLAELCRTQPNHADSKRWLQSMKAYGDYIKYLMKYTMPYGMIPAGIYRDDEPLDSDAFFSVHLFPPKDATQQFEHQATNGISVAPGYFVKRFPIWFNIFNGNLAIHSSMGKAAAICGNILNDPQLISIAREQLYWIVGKNPFNQSLIYGEGARYSSLNNFSSGEIVGAMPVGIRTLNDSDEPYWPQINNACYKEVWLTSAGKWLSLVAETDI